ncbi:MAG: hypothetical protein LBU32_00425 [Clostridiales bacterium]|jgi:hypothetical protein|nr:hypothetical protein [Clostridiales bacterium]
MNHFRSVKEMVKMLIKDRRFVVATTAVVLAALIITGTFAWTNFNANIVNSWQGAGSEPKGVLHDDFCNPNKDVYAENVGKVPIIVRIRLDEYMELGDGAGLKADSAGAPNPSNKSVPLISGGDLNDLETWKPHLLDNYHPELSGQPFNKYWDWKMGGQKYYFPAPADEVDGYVDGDSLEDLGPTDTNAVGVHSKLTPDASIITMGEWILNQQPGNYWVVDTDGWAYWAGMLQPGEATGLLLDSVTLKYTPEADYYYGVNVIAQFATPDGEVDEEGKKDNYLRFADAENGECTPNALALMQTISSAPAIYPSAISDGDWTVALNAQLIEGKAYVRQGSSLSASVRSSVVEDLDFSPASRTGYRFVQEANSLFVNVDPTVPIMDSFILKIIKPSAGGAPARSVEAPIVIIPPDAWYVARNIVYGNDSLYIVYSNGYQEILSDGALGDRIEWIAD